MNYLRTVLIILSIVSLSNCGETSNNYKSARSKEVPRPNNTTIEGKWVRVGPNGLLSIYFNESGKVEIDLGDDSSTEVVSKYEISNDTISFIDEKGKSCPERGVYKVFNRGYSVSFDLIDDLCNGRIKSTMGFWVRTNHNEIISELNARIDSSDDIELILHKARIYLALRKTKLAKQDFDMYIKIDSLDANVFINRAATRFPYNLEGVVDDCNKSIALDSTNKNAYFLRGLAFYGLEEVQKGCDDFQKSIDLGFKILREAEFNKCKDHW